MVLGFALAWGVVLASAWHLVEGGSLFRAFVVWITTGLVFVTLAFYFGSPNRRVKKFVAWGVGMLRKSPPTRPRGLSAMPVQQQSPAANDARPNGERPEQPG
jgi:hypothetical protein